MPTRAYVAHDKAVSVVRMYIQMTVVGFVLGSILYCALMAAVVSQFIAGPVPEVRFVNGTTRLVVGPDAPRLPLFAIIKYFVSFNPRNYFHFNLNPSKHGAPDLQEFVGAELQRFLGRQIVSREAYRAAVRLITHGRVEELRWLFPVSLSFFPLFGVCYFLAFRALNKKSSKTRFVRGADLIPFLRMKAKLQVAIQREKKDSPNLVPLQLGEAPLPDSVSRRHTLVLGTSGTGKSACLNNYLRSLNQRREACRGEVNKAIIYDVKGEFTGKHSRTEDILFYPFDQRSVPWSFFNEVLDYPDLDVLCTSLYEPPRDSRDSYWYNAARDVFRTGLFYLLRENQTSNRQIWEFFSQPLQQIRDALYTLPTRELGALKHIDKADSNQAASVISILQERLTFFRYLTDSDGTFSFRRFIRDETERRSLFLMNIRQYDAIFRSLMSFVIDIMIREVLSLSDSQSRRITFLIDEFGSLCKMPSIFDFLTMGRSKGGFLVLANQDLGSVAHIYGHDQKETFLNNFNLHLVFRTNDPTTADFLSKAFGEREVVKKLHSSQMSPSDLGDRFSISDQEKLEKIVLPTEFQSLPDFHAYLKVANYGLTRMETPRKFLPLVREEFVPRNFGLQQMLAEKSASVSQPQTAATPQLAP
ncbi:MAG: type IV secretion system DNA-binding domain-containing protein [Acidobacteria bacterium]|nr:type IV secretion system DNA-binding domain-containing protein [Acidobacteriota bacterium]